MRHFLDYELREPSINLCEELDLGHTSSSSCSSASSAVRKYIYQFNHKADTPKKVPVDGTDDRSHVFKSALIGAKGPFVDYPSHSILSPIGPTAWILMLDCRCVDYNSWEWVLTYALKSGTKAWASV